MNTKHIDTEEVEQAITEAYIDDLKREFPNLTVNPDGNDEKRIRFAHLRKDGVVEYFNLRISSILAACCALLDAGYLQHLDKRSSK
jgi:hypothetical protein